MNVEPFLAFQPFHYDCQYLTPYRYRVDCGRCRKLRVLFQRLGCQYTGDLPLLVHSGIDCLLKNMCGYFDLDLAARNKSSIRLRFRDNFGRGFHIKPSGFSAGGAGEVEVL